VKKVSEGAGNIVDQLLEKKIALLINTPMGSDAKGDDAVIRQAALRAACALHHDAVGRLVRQPRPSRPSVRATSA
jgi:hypothetical protein